MLLTGDSIEGAIATSVAYFDIFACAPDAGELHRFLVGYRATRAEVELALKTSPILSRVLGSRDGYYFLAGKEHLAPRRRRFSRHSAGLWPRAREMARVVAKSGLATCGMVTGSLAADNADEHADIDFLFIYPSQRTWTSYAAVRVIAKLPVLDKLCANYVLSDDSLLIRPQNVFTAWELAKAVPMFGFDVYRRMVLTNHWVTRYLPNALPLLSDTGRMPNQPDEHAAPPPPLPSKDSRFLRSLTGTPAFRALEAYEKKRKFAADRRDVGIDMEERTRSGSMDRHSPTRSFHVMSELRYRMSFLGLEAHPLFRELDQWTGPLDGEMSRWGKETIPLPEKKNGASPADAHDLRA